jgi:hypothetical protein
VRFAGSILAGEKPSIVITSEKEENPELTADYRGQDFAWWSRPAWGGPVPSTFKDWLTYRRTALTYDHVILWARSDLFPGANTGATQTQPTP